MMRPTRRWSPGLACAVLTSLMALACGEVAAPMAGDAAPDGAGGGGPDAASCPPTPVVRMPPELLLILDRSGSMIQGAPSKFAVEQASVTGLVTSPAAQALFAGLLWLPAMGVPDPCVAAVYESAVVPVGELGTGTAAAMTAEIAAAAPQGMSAFGAALQGTMTLAFAEAAAHPDRAVSVVFVADELPTGCGVTQPENFVPPPEVAATLATSGVRTFAVGLRVATPDPVIRPVFDRIAAAGGTSAFIIDPVAEPELGAALVAIQDRASCMFELPAPVPAGTQLVLRAPAPTALVESGDKTCVDGWYRESTRGVLCSDTCTLAVGTGSTLAFEAIQCP